MARQSYIHAVRKSAFKRGIVLPDVSELEEKKADEMPAKLVFRPTIPKDVKSYILTGVQEMKFTKISLHVVDNCNVIGTYVFKLLFNSILMEIKKTLYL